MENLTGAQLSTTIYVLLAIFAALITVDKVFDIIKKWRGPSVDTQRKLANDKARLDEQEKEINAIKKEVSELKDSSRVTMNGIMALLDHELHNGNAAQMESARDDIMKYLRDRI